MDIKIRKLGGLWDAVVAEGSTRIDLGLLTESEAKALAKTFREAAEDLDPEDRS